MLLGVVRCCVLSANAIKLCLYVCCSFGVVGCCSLLVIVVCGRVVLLLFVVCVVCCCC